MARPQKEGLDYFPLDINIDYDDKFQLLEAKYGLIGFAVIIKLIMKIYSEGYFYTWGEKESLLHSKRVNVNINEVSAIVDDSIKWGVFNKNLYYKYKILTSNGIQKRYWEVAKRRTEITIDKRYWIHNVDDILVSANINWINADIGTQRKEKESRVENIKEKYADYVLMFPEEYQKLIEKFGGTGTKERIEALNLWKGSKGKKTASDYLTILNWERRKKEETKQPHYQMTAAERKQAELQEATRRADEELRKEGIVLE